MAPLRPLATGVATAAHLVHRHLRRLASRAPLTASPPSDRLGSSAAAASGLPLASAARPGGQHRCSTLPPAPPSPGPVLGSAPSSARPGPRRLPAPPTTGSAPGRRPPPAYALLPSPATYGSAPVHANDGDGLPGVHAWLGDWDGYWWWGCLGNAPLCSLLPLPILLCEG